VTSLTASLDYNEKPPLDPELEKVLIEDRIVSDEMRRRFQSWQSSDWEFLRNADTELEFLDNPWIDPESKENLGLKLRSQGRSAFTVDILSPSIDLIVNQVRINKMTATFVPEDGLANKATAEIRQGLYANIDRESMASVARETGYTLAVMVGRGYWRVVIEDEDGPGHGKIIRIKPIENIHSVALDPTEDIRNLTWAGIWETRSREEILADFGKFDIYDQSLDLIGMDMEDRLREEWFREDKIRIIEYYRKRWFRRESARLSDGRHVWLDELAPEDNALVVSILKKKDYHIERRIMTGKQTLLREIWPGKMIPLVVCVGQVANRGRRGRINTGMIRKAMHPSMVNNYMYSRVVDEVALSPLPHMMAEQNQFDEANENIVKDINSRAWALVKYKAETDAQGRQLPLPHWVSGTPNIAAVVQAAEISKDNLQRVVNTYAPQLGRIQGDQSGRAIREIKDSGDVSHFAMPDNFNYALLVEAKIINDLMDKVYTEEQYITITNPDETTLRVLINGTGKNERTGKPTTYLFNHGKYGVTTSTGPSYTTRTQEASQKLLDLAKIFPTQVSLAIDLLIKDLNIPNSDKYADRLRDPRFNEAEDGPSPEELRAQLAAAMQNLDQADNVINMLMEKVQELGAEEYMRRLDIASKQAMNRENNVTKLMLKDIDARTAGAQAMLGARLQILQKAFDAQSNLGLEQARAEMAKAQSPMPATAGVDMTKGQPPMPANTGVDNKGLALA